MAGEPRPGDQGLDRPRHASPSCPRRTRFTAKLDATDPEGDPLVVRWEVRSESIDRRPGGDRETEPPAHPECFVEAKGLDATFRAPSRAGAYRLFAYLYDGKGGAAAANVPFAVRPR